MVVSRVLVSVDRTDTMIAEVTDRIPARLVPGVLAMLGEIEARLRNGDGEFSVFGHGGTQLCDGRCKKFAVSL